MDEGLGGRLPQPPPTRLSALTLAGSKLRFRLRLRLQVVNNTPSPMAVLGGVGVGIEGRAQNIAPLHLMRCLIVEYNRARWAIGRGANQWREGWWSFPPEWYGVFMGDLKWLKTVLFFGERAYEVRIHECE